MFDHSCYNQLITISAITISAVTFKAHQAGCNQRPKSPPKPHQSAPAPGGQPRSAGVRPPPSPAGNHRRRANRARAKTPAARRGQLARAPARPARAPRARGRNRARVAAAPRAGNYAAALRGGVGGAGARCACTGCSAGRERLSPRGGPPPRGVSRLWLARRAVTSRDSRARACPNCARSSTPALATSPRASQGYCFVRVPGG